MESDSQVHVQVPSTLALRPGMSPGLCLPLLSVRPSSSPGWLAVLSTCWAIPADCSYLLPLSFCISPFLPLQGLCAGCQLGQRFSPIPHTVCPAQAVYEKPDCKDA